LLATVMVALVGCVTINVYFHEAAAQKAADQFIGTVLDHAAPAPKSDTPPPAAKPVQPSAMLLDLLVPAAYAGDAPNIRIQNATTEAIRQHMQERFNGSLGNFFKSGAVGFTHDGMVAVRDAAAVPLNERAPLNATVAAENRDRAALYREVASANGHPEWEAQIRATFAKGWIERAPAGWYYQDAAGAWKRK
jgi:uncharacterized protein YdbL (DUF1318 family)